MSSNESVITILVNKRKRRYSETFINNHIEGLDARVLNIAEYLPLVPRQGISGLRAVYWKWRSRRNWDLFHRDHEKTHGPVLIEYGTTAAKAIPYYKSTGKDFVVHFHGYDAYQHDVLSKYHDEYDDIFRYARALVVVSKAMKEQLIKLGAPDDKIHYIVSGANAFFIDTDTHVVPDTPTFLICGRMVDKKAPYLAIRAFATALKKVPNMKLHVVGDGPLMEISKATATELGVGEEVKFLGRQTHQKVLQLMQGSTALIQHSVIAENGDAEGTPCVVQEAGAAGLPVIGSAHMGIAEVVQHGKTGLLVAEKDVDGMAEAIVKIALDRQLAAEMGVQARERIIENYSLEMSLAKLKELLYDGY